MIIPSATLAKDYVHMYSADPAFDCGYPDEPPTDPAELADWKLKVGAWTEKWRNALEENTLDQLPVFSGQKPTRWVIKHLRGKADKHLRDHDQEHRLSNQFAEMTLYRACQLALVAVKDATLEDGREFKIGHVMAPGTGYQEVPESTMQQLESIDSNGLIYEIGLRVLTQMYLPPKS